MLEILVPFSPPLFLRRYEIKSNAYVDFIVPELRTWLDEHVGEYDPVPSTAARYYESTAGPLGRGCWDIIRLHTMPDTHVMFRLHPERVSTGVEFKLRWC